MFTFEINFSENFQEEREKALLNIPHERQHLNLSDLKSDKTQYFESPFNNKSRSPFKPSEMSARSTINQKSSKKAFSDIDFDEIMQTTTSDAVKRKYADKSLRMGNARSSSRLLAELRVSSGFSDVDFDKIMQTTTSEAIRNKYRESIGMERLSSYPRTAEMSMRSSINSNASELPPAEGKDDFWNNVKVTSSGFNTKNCSIASDYFMPAEQMAEKMKQDEVEQEFEFATIPRVSKTSSADTNWEERGSMRHPEMSFGQYAYHYYQGNNIRDVYSGSSPSKDRKRYALVEMETSRVSNDENSRLNTNRLQK